MTHVLRKARDVSFDSTPVHQDSNRSKRGLVTLIMVLPVYLLSLVTYLYKGVG